MDIKELHGRIESLQRDIATSARRRETGLEELFAVFQVMENALKEYNQSTGGAEDDRRADRIIDMQSAIMDQAASIPAESAKGVLLKLAMWRWDDGDLDLPAEEMTRGDAVALSAFRDLARILKMESVLKPDARAEKTAAKEAPARSMRASAAG